MTDVKLYLQTENGPLPFGELTEFKAVPRYGKSEVVTLVEALLTSWGVEAEADRHQAGLEELRTIGVETFGAWSDFIRRMLEKVYGCELLPRRVVDRSKRRRLRARTYAVWARDERARKRLERTMRLHRRLTRRRRKRPRVMLWALAPLVRFPLFDQPFKVLEKLEGPFDENIACDEPECGYCHQCGGEHLTSACPTPEARR